MGTTKWFVFFLTFFWPLKSAGGFFLFFLFYMLLVEVVPYVSFLILGFVEVLSFFFVHLFWGSVLHNKLSGYMSSRATQDGR